MEDQAPAVPPRWSKLPARLQIPTQNFSFANHGKQRPPSMSGSIHSNPLYFGNITVQPGTPVTAMSHANPYDNPFMNPAKASEFLFNRFGDFKDFTMNTAKSGLSVGEKSAFWMYNKISKWSKKWFTHIFLFLVIMIYTGAGAALFMAVEGIHEKKGKLDTIEEKGKFAEEFRRIVKQNITLLEDPLQWEGQVLNWMDRFEDQIEKWIQEGKKKDMDDWSFWNAVFYCGTIYTTIGKNFITYDSKMI